MHPGSQASFLVWWCPCPHHTSGRRALSLPSLSTVAKVLWRVIPLMFQMKQAPEWVSLLLFLTVQFRALSASRHSETNHSIPTPMMRLLGAKAQPGWSLTRSQGRFCRCWSPKSRHLWLPDILGDAILPDAEEVTTRPLPWIQKLLFATQSEHWRRGGYIQNIWISTIRV